MSEKQEIYEGELVPFEEDGSLPAIMDNKLLQLADEAEKRIEAMNKIKRIVLGVTNNHDWIDQNGKPYLQVSGSEKVGRVFGISWDVERSPTIEEHSDGHFTYIFRGTFKWDNATITAEGSRSSKDPFFSRRSGGDVPPSEIDRRDVRMAAYTNLLGNGITRLLGIRNLTWEDVTVGGINKAMAGKVDYKKQNPATKDERDEIRTWLLAVCLDDKKLAADKLEELTTFEGNNGTVKGKRTVDKLTDKQVPIVHKQVKKLYDDYEKEFQDELEDGQITIEGEVENETDTETEA